MGIKLLRVRSERRLNWTSMVTITSTGLPCRVPGRNLHRLEIPWMAFSSRPYPRPLNTLKLSTRPFFRMTAWRVTIPSTLAADGRAVTAECPLKGLLEGVHVERPRFRTYGLRLPFPRQPLAFVDL